MKPTHYIVHVGEGTPEYKRIWCVSRVEARKCAALARSKMFTVRIEAMGFEMEYGYLQHGSGNGPFRTERVRVKHEMPDIWSAWFEGRWYKVHANLSKTWIVYRGERITIQIAGV